MLPGCAAPLYVSLRCFNNKAWGPQATLMGPSHNVRLWRGLLDDNITWPPGASGLGVSLPCAHCLTLSDLTMRAWPVARSIFDAPLFFKPARLHFARTAFRSHCARPYGTLHTASLTGDARLEFFRNSARRLKMRERIERACQTLPGLPRAARPSGRFAEGKTLQRGRNVKRETRARGLVGYQPTNSLLSLHNPVARAARALAGRLCERGDRPNLSRARAQRYTGLANKQRVCERGDLSEFLTARTCASCWLDCALL